MHTSPHWPKQHLFLNVVFFFALAVCASSALAEFTPGVEFYNQPALSTVNILPAYNAGLSGAGVRLGLVDSGINPNHIEFRNAIVAGYDSISERSCTSDFSSFLQDYVNHGTMVASVAAGRLDGATHSDNLQGVAYNASLVIGAMNFEPGYLSRIASAMNYVSSQSVKVINNSWETNEAIGDPLSDYQILVREGPMLISAIKTALDRGSVLVFTTGNDAALNPGTPATLPVYAPEIAAKGGFIVVAATTNDGKSLASYSTRCGIANEYCIAAPGGDGLTDKPLSDILGADRDSDTGYFYQAGTSLSAPIVSGAVALVAEQFPWMTNKNLSVTILTTGNNAFTPDPEWGRGLLDIGKAINGPALFEDTFEANIPGGSASIFSNDIGYRAGLNGGLTKLGAGTLTLTGVDSYTGLTLIDAGTLVVNGSLIGPVTVGAGGTLCGTGSLSGRLTVNGTLKPGDSPGTLAVTNNVTINAGSVFMVDIDGTATGSGAGNYSRLLVNGVDNQFSANGTLRPIVRGISGSATNNFTPALGDGFRIVHAEGRITGRFSTITQPGELASGTRFAAFYDVFDNHSIDLKVLPSSYSEWLYGNNRNVRSSANTLDQILLSDQEGCGTSDQTQLLYAAADKTALELPEFAKSLAGEIHGALATATPQAGQWLEGAVARHLGGGVPNLRQNANGAGANKAGNAVEKKGLWMDIGANKSRWSSDSNASGFTSDQTQLVIGADLLSHGQMLFGAGISYAETTVSADIGEGTLKGTMGFVFAQYPAAGVLLDGLVSYGVTPTKSERPDPTGLTGGLKSSTTSHNTLLSVGIRKPVEAGSFIIEPFSRMTWQTTRRQAFDEGNAVSSLDFSRHSENGLRTVVGVSGGSVKQNPLANANTYRLSIGVGYDAGGLTRPEQRASLAGIDTTIAAPMAGRAFTQTGVSGTARFNNRAYSYLNINGEIGEGRSDVGINAGVAVTF